MPIQKFQLYILKPSMRGRPAVNTWKRKLQQILVEGPYTVSLFKSGRQNSPTTDVIFYGSDNKFNRKKGSHILHRPDHLVDCWPPPRTHCTPCLLRCPLVPVLLRHGGHSAALVARMSYTRLLVLSSINSLTGSVLKNRSTTTSIGTSLP